MLALASGLGLAATPGRTEVGSQGAVALAPTQVLEDALTGSLERLFADPGKILEIGIRQPPRELEKSRAELRRFFSGARLQGIEVGENDSAQAIRGYFPEVQVDFQGLTLMGLRLETARFHLRALRVDPVRLLDAGELEVRGLQEIGMAFSVGAAALNKVTDTYRIRLPRGRFEISGRRKLLILPMGFKASGRLDFTEAGQINFLDRDIRLGGLPLPSMFRRALRRRINPVFDLGKYLGSAAEVFRVRFEHIAHRPGELVLTARAEVDLEEPGSAG
jgi:hypothetical protein